MNEHDPIEGWLAGQGVRGADDSTVADDLAVRARTWADLVPHLPEGATGPWLIYRDPAGVVAVKLEKVSVIGRAEDADIRPGCPWLSRRHFELRPSHDRCHFRDLGGRNPVKINGKRAAERDLVSGDLLTVADAGFLFVLATPAVRKI